ncbi:hypothetical protein QVM41_22130 [Pseudomonas shirazica]|uniref:hypothetical protein n=1 Tax=Pseudomonas shirazica TaxID=1940636 RepID=UPI003524FA47
MNTFAVDAESLIAVAIPEQVVTSSLSPIIEIHTAGLNDLPYPLSTATLWVACCESWPHADPDWEGLYFINLAIQADHMFSQVGPDNQFLTLDVRPGTVFLTNPLALHWLQPSDKQLNRIAEGLQERRNGYIGLQWEVAYHEIDAKVLWLKEELVKLGNVEQLGCDIVPLLIQPEADYVQPPPGHDFVIGPEVRALPRRKS